MLGSARRTCQFIDGNVVTAKDTQGLQNSATSIGNSCRFWYRYNLLSRNIKSTLSRSVHIQVELVYVKTK